jgi:hypothetical protein
VNLHLYDLPRPYSVQGHGDVVFALHKPKRLACERLPGKRRPDVDWSARAAAGCHLCRSSPPQLLGTLRAAPEVSWCDQYSRAADLA